MFTFQTQLTFNHGTISFTVYYCFRICDRSHTKGTRSVIFSVWLRRLQSTDNWGLHLCPLLLWTCAVEITRSQNGQKTQRSLCLCQVLFFILSIIPASKYWRTNNRCWHLQYNKLTYHRKKKEKLGSLTAENCWTISYIYIYIQIC